MIIPFRRKRNLKQNIGYHLEKAADSTAHHIHKLPSAGFVLSVVKLKARKYLKMLRYVTEDSAFELRKFSRHTEALLFSAILMISAFMLISSGGESVLNSLIAMLMLVLIVVIYTQLKLQKRMISQYVPLIEMIRVKKCQLYSDRIRMVNLYAAKDKMPDIGKIMNIVIGYDVVNDSYSPISIEGASLAIRLKKGGRISLPTSVSILDVEPKRTSGTEVQFRLRKPIAFDSIEWLELELKGNCTKKVRLKPHLWVNIMLREKIPKFIKEPFDKFMKRRELAE